MRYQGQYAVCPAVKLLRTSINLAIIGFVIVCLWNWESFLNIFGGTVVELSIDRLPVVGPLFSGLSAVVTVVSTDSFKGSLLPDAVRLLQIGLLSNVLDTAFIGFMVSGYENVLSVIKDLSSDITDRMVVSVLAVIILSIIKFFCGGNDGVKGLLVAIVTVIILFIGIGFILNRGTAKNAYLFMAEGIFGAIEAYGSIGIVVCFVLMLRMNVLQTPLHKYLYLFLLLLTFVGACVVAFMLNRGIKEVKKA